MEYLYILKRSDNLAYKLGVTKNVTSKLKNKKEFDNVILNESLVFTCDNRVLIEQIKNGILAFLHNDYYSINKIESGSTDWFKMDSFDKCMSFINIYLTELKEFNENGVLSEFLNKEPDYKSELNEINESQEFVAAHSSIVDKISSFIAKYNELITFEKRSGYYVLICPKANELVLDELPIFNWVVLSQNEICFDIKVINEWKKAGIQKVIRKVIELKFFNVFSLEHLGEMFKQ